MKFPATKISHVDLVVSSIERSLPFYVELLDPLGWSKSAELLGEHGQTIHYIAAPGPGMAAIGLREAIASGHDVPYERRAVGIDHLCLDVPSREVVDERADWSRARGIELIGGPREYDYTPGYYAVFIPDPDGIKLELLHRPSFWKDGNG